MPDKSLPPQRGSAKKPSTATEEWAKHLPKEFIKDLSETDANWFRAHYENSFPNGAPVSSKRKTGKNHSWDSPPWDKQQSQAIPKRKTMTNKFLPFIVEKSTPMHIFQTLISRSKGMNLGTIASIFYMVVDKGITELRSYVKVLPELTLEKIYENLVSNYPSYRISNEQLQLFIELAPFIRETDYENMNSDLSEYERKDLMVFMLVMSLLGKTSAYTSLNFEAIFPSYEKVLGNVQKHVTFSDIGKKMRFSNAAQLKAFILYEALITSEKVSGPICAVISDKGSKL